MFFQFGLIYKQKCSELLLMQSHAHNSLIISICAHRKIHIIGDMENGGGKFNARVGKNKIKRRKLAKVGMLMVSGGWREQMKMFIREKDSLCEVYCERKGGCWLWKDWIATETLMQPSIYTRRLQLNSKRQNASQFFRHCQLIGKTNYFLAFWYQFVMLCICFFHDNMLGLILNV